MTQKINISLKQAFVVLMGLALVSALLVIARPQPAEAQAGACSALPSDKGLATHTESGVGSGEYTVFARVKVASGPATFDLSIDGAGGSLCDLQVSQDGSNGNWVWYSSGSQKLSWTGGDMRFQMSGDKNGVGLDCVVLFDLTQGSFNPSTKEDCNPSSGSSTDATGAAATGATSGCTPVSFAQASAVLSSFLRKTLQPAAADFDTNSDSSIDFGEASAGLSKFLRKQCL